MDNLIIRKRVDNDAIPWELLLLADPSKKSILNYLNKGDMYLAYLGSMLVGEYILAKQVDAAEIENMAVAEKYQNNGIGKKLIQDAIKRAKEQGVHSLRVGTGNSSIGQLAFYQKCGFRIVEVLEDFFIKNHEEEIWENGIKCRDMIVLEMKL